ARSGFCLSGGGFTTRAAAYMRLVATLSALTKNCQAGVALHVRNVADVRSRQVQLPRRAIGDAGRGSELLTRYELVTVGKLNARPRFSGGTPRYRINGKIGHCRLLDWKRRQFPYALVD